MFCVTKSDIIDGDTSNYLQTLKSKYLRGARPARNTASCESERRRKNQQHTNVRNPRGHEILQKYPRTSLQAAPLENSTRYARFFLAETKNSTAMQYHLEQQDAFLNGS